MSEFTAANPYVNGNSKNGRVGPAEAYNRKVSTVQTVEDEDEFDRGHWGSKAEFILSCIGFSVSQLFVYILEIMTDVSCVQLHTFLKVVQLKFIHFEPVKIQIRTYALKSIKFKTAYNIFRKFNTRPFKVSNIQYVANYF